MNAETLPSQEKTPSKPWYRKIWIWIIGIILIGAAIQGLNHQTDRPPEQTSGAGSASGRSGAPGASDTGRQHAAGIGETAASGSFELMATSIQTGLTSLGTEPITTKPQGQFVVASLSVKNTGKKAEYLASSSVKLLAADGTEYSVTDSASIYLGKDATIFSQINPGNTLQGKMAFDIPVDAKPTTLQFSGGLFETPVKITIG